MRITYLGHAGLRVDGGGPAAADGPVAVEDRARSRPPGTSFPPTLISTRPACWTATTSPSRTSISTTWTPPSWPAWPDTTTVLIPRYPSPNFRDRLKAAGVANVIEVPAWQQVPAQRARRLADLHHRAIAHVPRLGRPGLRRGRIPAPLQRCPADGGPGAPGRPGVRWPPGRTGRADGQRDLASHLLRLPARADGGDRRGEADREVQGSRAAAAAGQAGARGALRGPHVLSRSRICGTTIAGSSPPACFPTRSRRPNSSPGGCPASRSACGCPVTSTSRCRDGMSPTASGATSTSVTPTSTWTRTRAPGSPRSRRSARPIRSRARTWARDSPSISGSWARSARTSWTGST